MEELILSRDELDSFYPGEAISVTAVMAILLTAIVSVIVYRIFASKSGAASIPGGFKFEWK